MRRQFLTLSFFLLFGTMIASCKRGDESTDASGESANGDSANGDTDGQGKGTVEGWARLEGQSEHAGIAIALGGTGLSDVTDDTGYFLINNVPPGVYIVTASLAGYEEQESEPFVVIASETVSVEPLTLPEADGNLQGYVFLSVGTDFSDTTVKLQGTTFVALTDPSGLWGIQDVPASNYTVIAGHKGFEDAERSDQEVIPGGLTKVPDITLVKKLEFGNTCLVNENCLSGYCADGVCCDKKCNGICRTCNGDVDGSGNTENDELPGKGTCQFFEKGVDLDEECPDMMPGCQASCNGEGGCRVKSGSGIAGMCIAQGADCSASGEVEQCATGFCVDSVCCNNACDGTCEVCNKVDSMGICMGHARQSDPENECPDNILSFGCSGVCDGRGGLGFGACMRRHCPNGTVCTNAGNGEAICESGNCVNGYCCESMCSDECMSCDKDFTGKANGLCREVQAGLKPIASCPDNGLCIRVCNGSNECRVNSGLGVAVDCLDQGADCSATGEDEQCTTGYCTDGFCCDTECSGPCVSCNAAGSEGICTPFLLNTDPKGECPSGETCNGNGICAVTECDLQKDFTPCIVVTSHDYNYEVCVDGLCVSPGTCDDTSCNTPGPHFQLPDTRQQGCYYMSMSADCSSLTFDGGTPCSADGKPEYCGQDAQYGWDAIHDEGERYTVHHRTSKPNEAVIRDEVTKLMWQRCIANQNGYSCAEGEIEPLSWSAALQYCETLSWGGYTDWRLPDRYELMSTHYMNGSEWCVESILPDPMDTEGNGSKYWSSSATGASTAGYLVRNEGGFFSDGDKSEKKAVRCVRGVPSPQTKHFSRTGTTEPIVHDHFTGLIWQGCAAGQGGGATSCSGTAEEYNRQDALRYCESLNWGGVDDWRMPNAIELNSIVDVRNSIMSIDQRAFPDTPPDVFWSSTTAWPGVAFYIDFSDGRIEGWDGIKTDEKLVRCVRDAP